MYIPRHFLEQDESQLLAFISAYGFATLVSSEQGVPFASHLPLLAERDASGGLVLVGHMARGNPQWRSFTHPGEVLALFRGPHAYVSPSCYHAPSVPTWNYAVVHAYCAPRLLEEPGRVLHTLRRLSDKYEAGRENPWSVDSAPEVVDKLLHGIVAFELSVRRLEGKFKLSQNRDAEDHASVMRFVEQDAQPGSEGLVELMRARPPVR